MNTCCDLKVLCAYHQAAFEEHVATLQQLAPFTVYLYYDRAGRPLYVGITGRGIDRSREHSRYAVWWELVVRAEIEHYETEADARTAEREHIADLRPLFNVADVPAAVVGGAAGGVENPMPAPSGIIPPYGGEDRRPVRAEGELSSDGSSPLWDGYVSERDKDLRTTWGLKLEQWEAIRLAGDPHGGCAACGRRTKRLVVDDDHDTGEICGTLCDPCNRKITERLRRYVQNPPARQVGPFFISEQRQAARVQARLRREERKGQAKAMAKAKTAQPARRFTFEDLKK